MKNIVHFRDKIRSDPHTSEAMADAITDFAAPTRNGMDAGFAVSKFFAQSVVGRPLCAGCLEQEYECLGLGALETLNPCSQ